MDLYGFAQGNVSEYVACEQDSDCLVRVAECCECGASITLDNLVAIRSDERADFERLVCEPGTACRECAPDYGPFFAWCGADGEDMPPRCRVDSLGP